MSQWFDCSELSEIWTWFSEQNQVKYLYLKMLSWCCTEHWCMNRTNDCGTWWISEDFEF